MLNCWAFSSQAQTNVFHPFPENAVWRVDYHHWHPHQDICSLNYYFHYYLAGDTLLNGTQHRKVYRSDVIADTISGCNNGLWSAAPTVGYVGAILEDSVSNKTFFVFSGSATDSLLFNYNLEVGDTLTGILPSGFYFDTVTVSSIDSVWIESSPRKRWHFSPINLPWIVEPYIIEGIGSSMGLFDQINTFANDFKERYLVCLKSDNVVVFETDYESLYGCNFVSIPEVRSKTPDLILYPNPTDGQVKIDTDMKRSLNLEVYNIQGKIIYTESNLNSNSVVDLKGIKSGLYYVRFYNSELNLLRQLLIQK